MPGSKTANAVVLQKKILLDALHKSLGIVTDACRKTGIARQTYYDWMKNDNQFKADVEGLSEVALDFVESKLFKSIDTGNPIPAIFYLKTKGRGRGYIEKQEIDHTTNGKDMLPRIEVTFYDSKDQPAKDE